MQRSLNMVHSHFTLCLRTRPHTKWAAQHPWYGLWMKVKGPHHFMVTALGSCVKWPLSYQGTPSLKTSLGVQKLGKSQFLGRALESIRQDSPCTRYADRSCGGCHLVQ